MKNDSLVKGMIDAVGGMLDSRFKTWEVNLKAYIDDRFKTSEANMKTYVGAEIKASETRIRGDMATKDDIKNIATKDDILELKTGQKRIEEKLDKKSQADEKRFSAIEQELNIPRIDKN